MAAPAASTHGSARGGTTLSISGGTCFPEAAAIQCAAREFQNHVQSRTPLQDLFTNQKNSSSYFCQTFTISPSNGSSIHLSNAFDGATGTLTDPDCCFDVCVGANASVGCSPTEKDHAAIEQFGPQFIACTAQYPRETVMLFSTSFLCAFWQSLLWLRGSALMVPAFWPRSFGFQYSRLGSFGCRSLRLDAMNPFEFVVATPLLH